jgi:hypothetical protein
VVEIGEMCWEDRGVIERSSRCDFVILVPPVSGARLDSFSRTSIFSLICVVEHRTKGSAIQPVATR